MLIENSFRNCPIKDDDQAQVHDSTTRAQSGTKTSNFIHLLMGINLLMTSWLNLKLSSQLTKIINNLTLSLRLAHPNFWENYSTH